MVGPVKSGGYASAVQRLKSTTEATQTRSATQVGDAKSAQKFDNAVTQALGKVDAAQHDADSVLQELASGDNVDIHNTMIALEKADIALRTMVSVRDKLVGAYEQVMNTAL